MALCDELEEAQKSRERRRDRLATSAQRRMIEATSDPEAFRASAGFYLQRLPRLATRPEHISELRRTVLDLAVRGRLVPQRPDESTVSLTESLAKGANDLIAHGWVRRAQPVTALNEEEIPFPVPGSWTWRRLGLVGAVVGGGTPRKGAEEIFTEGGTGTAWLTPADLGKHESRYIVHGRRDLTQHGLKASSATLMPPGTVLFSSRAPIGHVAIAAGEVSTNQGFKSLVPFIPEMSEYIYLFFKAFGPSIDQAASGTTFKEVSSKQVARLPFPLPPLEEQARIVAKVDELMTICDELDNQLRKGSAKRSRLLEAVLHEALA